MALEIDAQVAAGRLAAEWAQVNAEHVRFAAKPGNQWAVQYAGRLAGLQTAARVLGIQKQFDAAVAERLSSAREVRP